MTERRITSLGWLTWTVASCVALVAMAIRLPLCYESFWLDELHSAWSIWSGLDHVSQRAIAGNQTPLYFQLLWGWKFIGGASEFALRASSVLASSLASGLLVIAIKQTTDKLAPGLIAGLLLAVESNSVFFGTELRPYAAVMLGSVVTTWLACLAIQSGPKNSARYRLGLVIAICFVALIHPTSLATLGWFLPLAPLLAIRRGWSWLDVLSVTCVLATVFVLYSTLDGTWERREQWKAFAKSTQWRQLWLAWPWISVAIVPMGLGMISCWRSNWRDASLAVGPMAIAVIATCIIFVASYFDFIYLWHRRYFIATLPLLAWSAGTMPALGWLGKSQDCCSNRLYQILISLFGVGILLGLLWQQGSWAWIAHQEKAGTNQKAEARPWFPVQIRGFAQRGEGWRGAIAWVNQHHQAGQSIWLDSGLIEASILQRESIDAIKQRDLGLYRYLKFPVHGPYQVPATPVSLHRFRPQQNSWLISRNGYRTLRIWLGRTTDFQVRRFGSIFVVRIR